jgi:hypothetical protein
MKSWTAPDGVPVLSRGRHRSPRRGACFMEFASFLAGERWSDHPACTHPLLAQLARRVNDLTSDAGRQELVPLIPSVVGRLGDDDTWITLPVAVAATPILDVPEATQRVLAAGLLSAHRVCVQAGPDLTATGRQAREALDLVPHAVAWAQQLPVPASITSEIFARRSAPTMVRCAIDGIVESGTTDRDARLRGLLEVAIAACPAPPEMHRAPEKAEREGSARVRLGRRR